MSSETSTTTEIGSYFVTNYPPYSLWKRENVHEIVEAFEQPPRREGPLGLYIHIPFCRKRCKFCYFRVYTDQNAKAIENYVQALIKEVALLAEQPGIAGRKFDFVYFGGGTPSYLSAKQLKSLRDRLHQSISWDDAREVTFECEPGTLSLDKVKTLRDIGVTRVSLGVENFDDKILEENGRAHLTPEVERAYGWIQDVGFPQVNIDLIAGMVGETDENWADCVDKAGKMSPDNITIYQMELPYNTIISKEMQEGGLASPVASWATKRRWVDEAFNTLAGVGYKVSSGNEVVKNLETDKFIYRDSLFRGIDLLGTGVASFGHFQGVHYQNLDQLNDYVAACDEGRLPVNRALTPSPHQTLIREVILQLKEGRISGEPFRQKFGVDIFEEFRDAFAAQQAAGYLTVEGDEVILTRRGLLQVDSLLTEYFEEEHREVRYT
ncbi:Oxygen-independent coproporphyrinogen-III oxidase [Symmachiella dynata]|uniref:coproporphyrinogen-III oxidase family protein n=1 Tax=Symmachiella dynata TaxID=2527995 RepID=UPI00118949FF|nr:coproporphyrinogen-III oxidase family protein [Symmachiella dynata]QDT47160.1 Oxygen-independent coproporphyrinogen-III oxidase [Symmachiella dynata]